MLHTVWKHNECDLKARVITVATVHAKSGLEVQISIPGIPLFQCWMSQGELEAKFTLETQPNTKADA